jgi:hypothetical protein
MYVCVCICMCKDAEILDLQQRYGCIYTCSYVRVCMYALQSIYIVTVGNYTCVVHN